MEIPVETKNFLDDVRNIFRNRFPNSIIQAGFGNNICPAITIRFYLAKDENECSSKIFMNDPCRTVFMIYDIDNNGKLFDKISVERIYGKNIIRAVDKNNPDEKYLAYGSIPVKFRKMKNTKEKVLAGFRKYVDELASIILDNAEAINNGIIHNLYDVRNKISN